MRTLEEVAQDLATSVLLLGIFVIHNTVRSGEDETTELTSREDFSGIGIDFSQVNIVTRRDDTSLVDATEELNNDLTRTTVIDDFE
jgi:hypothetical protein